MDDVMKNKDVRQAQFKNLGKIEETQRALNVTEFNSVDQIYFFMDEMFSNGFDEKLINIALDVFLRDFG